MFISLITGAVIPWGKTFHLTLAGIFTISSCQYRHRCFYLMGMVSIGVYGIMLGGWASNNKYSFDGS